MGVILGYYIGKEVWPRNNIEKTNALFLHKHHFRLIWKSEGSSFNQAVKQLKPKFEIVDNHKTEENVNSHFEYKYTAKKLNQI